MKEFFFNLLKQLDKLTGIRQFDKLISNPEAEKEIGDLLTILCRVCEQFPFIPDNAKQGIIMAAVISDQEFIGLNAKIIFKWLNAQKDRFIGTGNQYEELKQDAPALEGEARDKKLQEWLQSVSKMETNFSSGMNDQLRTYFNNLYKPTGNEQRPKISGPEEVWAKQMHLEYIKANFDPRTGKPLPTFVDEIEWLKTKS